jgi:hypothetical protein
MGSRRIVGDARSVRFSYFSFAKHRGFGAGAARVGAVLPASLGLLRGHSKAPAFGVPADADRSLA